MAVATFGPSSGWASKKISREGDVFENQRHGEISPFAIGENIRLGHLIWVNNGTRAWVGSLARNPVEWARRIDVESPNKAPEDGHRPRTLHQGAWRGVSS
jgi:hypothetical protein